jgi:IS5 family transposase
MNKSGLILLGHGPNERNNAMRQRGPESKLGFEKYGRKSRRELFLDAMNEVVPWAELEALIAPHYPKTAYRGRPTGLSIMLRVFFVQQWFKVSDAGIEEALYDSAALRRFVGVDLARAPAPDVTTVSRFRQLLEAHELGNEIMDTVSRHLDEKGVRISTGTITDASIIYEPS